MGGLSRGLITLSGENGAGKTNILEALSLLTPGRGLRGAKPLDIQKNGNPDKWAIAATVQTPSSPIKIGTGLDRQSEKRIIRLNGQNLKRQTILNEYLSCIWLTPQMDRLFLDSAGHRRRFFDRLILALDPGHSTRLSRYDNALSQRSKILKEARNTNITPDATWLTGLESQIVEAGIAISAARLDFVQRLQTACNNENHDHFPLATLEINGTIEELLKKFPALEVEALFKFQLEDSRKIDMYTGGAATGPHKSDLNVIMSAKSMSAAQCSTGEQKALLIGIIIAHARLISAECGRPPLLLLDEVAAHLDKNRRAALYDILESLNTQTWLTGTDRNLFSFIEKTATFFTIKNATIYCDSP